MQVGVISTEICQEGELITSRDLHCRTCLLVIALGCVEITTSWPVVGRANIGIPSHLHPTIYMSEPGVQTKLSGQVGQGPDSLDMLSIAIKIKNDRPRSVKV